MASAQAIRIQIEAALASRIPSALTPPAKFFQPTQWVGIDPLDELLGGGFPIGSITELVGEQCSGKASVALSLLAEVTAAGNVCAWIDASDTFDPASAASVGVDLNRLLWVRCGVRETLGVHETKRFELPEACFVPRPAMKGLHGGGHGTHPRSEVRGLPAAVDRFLRHEALTAHCAEPISKPRPSPKSFEQNLVSSNLPVRKLRRSRIYDAIEQALRSTDLLIQTGGFSTIVLDLGEIQPQFAARIELSTWHRYRVASEQTQSSMILLSQFPCAKSSCGLQLRLFPMEDSKTKRTVFTGLNARAEILRQRFVDIPTNVIPMRKPPQRAQSGRWSQRTSWVGPQ